MCNSSCDGTTPSTCGNGTVESGEDCDDSNTTTETCDYGETSCSVCDSSYASVAGATSYCGDGTIDSANSETCDDGANNGQPNMCNSTCDGTVSLNNYGDYTAIYLQVRTVKRVRRIVSEEIVLVMEDLSCRLYMKQCCPTLIIDIIRTNNLVTLATNALLILL